MQIAKKIFKSLKISSIVLCISTGTIIGLAAFPSEVSAYHVTNKRDIRESLEDGWIVVYSEEFSHAEYLRLAAAIGADAAGGYGGFTSAYFETFIQRSLQRVVNEAERNAPGIARELINNLSVDRLTSAIGASFDGRRIELSITGVRFQVGRATYNRQECLDTGIFGTRCVDTPNTYQPYIRFQVPTNSQEPNNPPPQNTNGRTIRVCNNSDEEIRASFGYLDNDDVWKASGWYPVNPGACRNTRSGLSGVIYAYATTDTWGSNSTAWRPNDDTSARFCVDSRDAFTNPDYYCEGNHHPDYRWETFNELVRGGNGVFTWTLND